MSTNKKIAVVLVENQSSPESGLQAESTPLEASLLDPTIEGDTTTKSFQNTPEAPDLDTTQNKEANESAYLQIPKPIRPAARHAHFRNSLSLVSAPPKEWDEFIHPNGSLYWACSMDSVRVVSDIQPPLSKIQTETLTDLSRLLNTLDEIPQIDNYQNWEIYTDGRSCVYIHHGSRSASETAQSLEGFKAQIEILRGDLDIASKLKLESAYWAFMQAHPNHRYLPEGALDDTLEALVWCHADRVLFKTSNAPFAKEDAHEMTDLMRTISELKRPKLKTWYCAAIMRAISENRLGSHYGQNDAREVRRRERTEDLTTTITFESWWHSTIWRITAMTCLGTPFGYLKRISNVDRTTIGDGINTLRWRIFLQSLCKDWQDSNLLATVLISATVALLAVPGLNELARIAGIISAICAASSTICGTLLTSSHQGHLDGSGGAGITYFREAKRRVTGTTHPLALIYSLPTSLMLWAMFWFVFSIASYAYSTGLPGISHYSITTRIISFIVLGTLSILGAMILVFFNGLWESQHLRTRRPSAYMQPSTAIRMVNRQGGNPLTDLPKNQLSEILGDANPSTSTPKPETYPRPTKCSRFSQLLRLSGKDQPSEMLGDESLCTSTSELEHRSRPSYPPRFSEISQVLGVYERA